jgi:hypothetical protein
MRRGGGAGEITEDVASDIVRLDHVVLDEAKPSALQQQGGVGPRPGMVVIEPDDFMSVGQKAMAKIRSQEAS